MSFDESRIARYRQELRDEETPEPEPLEAQELHDAWQRGNQRRPIPPKLSDNHKVDLVLLENQWIAFAATLGCTDWKALLKTLSYDNRGLGESFLIYLMRNADNKRRKIAAESTVRRHTRKLKGLFKKYTGKGYEETLGDHLLHYAMTEITPKWNLRREPKRKPVIGPDFFIYHMQFLWVRDTSRFHIGLDRLDDASLRLLYMFTGCRKHELVMAGSPKTKKYVQRYNEESDAYTDIDCGTAKDVGRRAGTCWVCGGLDDRSGNRALKVLCWEDIALWIIRDPEGNGGRDCLAMQVLLRWHKGENNKIVPTRFDFVEENLPVLCPISHILAKAIAEGVINEEGYQSQAEPFFRTRLNQAAIQIKWKEEWLHKPVFRRTLNALGEKTDEPLTALTFDSHSNRLGIAMGVHENMAQYNYRRGAAGCVNDNYRQSIRDQVLRHKPNSTTYQEHYNNNMTNAVIQDAFLGRGTKSPYLAILNYMGLCRDENAPKGVSNEFMRMIGPTSKVRRLQQEADALGSALEERYGRPSRAPEHEKSQNHRKLSQLRAARQKDRRKMSRKAYRDYFKDKDKEELQKQLRGIHEPPVERQVTHTLPARNRLADILGDLDEDLPEEDIVRRKVHAINLIVSYSLVCEPLVKQQRASPPLVKQQPASNNPPLPSASAPAIIRQPISPQLTGSLSLPSAPAIIGRPITPKAMLTPSPGPSEIPAVPPPPYSKVDPALPVPVAQGLTSRRRPRNKPEACIFCSKTYTRRGVLWNHLEGHLAQAKDGTLACPRTECGGIVLENPSHFKAHAARFHGCSFRPKIVITSGKVQSSGNATTPQLRIVLVSRGRQGK